MAAPSVLSWEVTAQETWGGGSGISPVALMVVVPAALKRSKPKSASVSLLSEERPQGLCMEAPAHCGSRGGRARVVVGLG